MSGQLSAVDGRKWDMVYNAGSTPVPPFGVMRSTGLDADKIYTIDQPNADSMTDVFVNGHLPIAPGTFGEGTRSDPATVLIETAGGTPASGDDYGTQSGSWKAHKGKLGFRCMGSVGDNTVEATFYGSSYKRLVDSVSGITVKDHNTSPWTTVTSTTTLVVDKADGFNLSEVSAGVARLDLYPSGRDQSGIVDHGETDAYGRQEFKGVKAFVDGITIGTQMTPPPGESKLGGAISFQPQVGTEDCNDVPDAYNSYGFVNDHSHVYIQGYGSQGADPEEDEVNMLDMNGYAPDMGRSAKVGLVTTGGDINDTKAYLYAESFATGLEYTSTVEAMPGGVRIRGTNADTLDYAEILVGSQGVVINGNDEVVINATAIIINGTVTVNTGAIAAALDIGSDRRVTLGVASY